MKAIRRFSVRTALPAQLAPLTELALNLRWVWHAPTRELFASLDPQVWQQTGGDPLALLGSLPPGRLDELAADQEFVARLQQAHGDLRAYLSSHQWFQGLGSEAPRAIAYFSPEFGITKVLPQYSGGLGILAGDHLKAASDLGVPIIGVGLLYRAGYFRQSLNREGWQQETYPVFDPNGLPLSLLREPDGSRTYIELNLPTGRLLAQIWVAQVGRVPLLLMDTDIEGNEADERDITDRLYGGGHEHRLKQEMLLGIGGVRALRAYQRVTGSPAPEVFHTNEGHAGFLGLERIREMVSGENGSAGLSFDEALEAVRAGTVFTTHTPVPAGIDRFGSELIEQYFGAGVGLQGVPVDRILALGAEDYPGGDPKVFNMAVMGLRLGQRANGVSQLHGHVSRQMFSGLWPGLDEHEVPISSITNGVHDPTWVAQEVYQLAAKVAGHPAGDAASSYLAQASDSDLWALRTQLRTKLVEDARNRVRASWLERGASKAELGWVDQILDPNVLTIGFARRVPSYKRLTLMLRDKDRLRSLLLHPQRPIQLVIAGKAHPADEGGKKLIQELVQFADEADVRHRIVFLPNYDMGMADTLLTGTDVWLNNPLRPLEACGTSGMKSALNGGLQLSVLDGWWDEWYNGENGWEIHTADGVEDPDRRDELEAQGLYDLIENSVAPLFYTRDAAGNPTGWLEKVRNSLTSLGPKVLAGRMVRDYVEKLYAPAALSSRQLAQESATGVRELAYWKAHMRNVWPQVHVDHVETGGVADTPELGSVLQFRAFVSLGSLQPSDVVVQVVHGRVDFDDQLTDTDAVELRHTLTYEGGRHRFDGELKLERTGPFGYTVRIMPQHKLMADPAELGLTALPPQTEAPTELPGQGFSQR